MFDDICIYSDGFFEHHLFQVDTVLIILRQASLILQSSSMRWDVVNRLRLSAICWPCIPLPVYLHPESIQPISDYSAKKKILNLQICLSILFYSKCIHNFATFTHPLNKLKRKGAQFIWRPELEQAIHTLKSKLTINLIWRLSYFTKKCIVHSELLIPI